MKGQFMKKALSCIMAVALLVPCFSGVSEAKDEVKHGTVDYYIEMKESTDFFIYNKETLGSAVGTKYYMTYTVESAKAEEFRQNGVIGTSTPAAAFPYEKSDLGGGIYKYDHANKLLVEGNTYFLEFTITEDGYDYRIGWAENERSRYVKFEQVHGEVKTGLEYFGVWSGDLKVTGKLTKVRVYDKDGNDLGVQVSGNRNATVGREKPFPKDTKVPHSYTIEIQNGYNVALSNKRMGSSDKIYMEYKVKSSDTQVYQAGAIASNTPTASFPYLSGQLIYNMFSLDPKVADDGPLLVEGAEYLIIFEKKADRFNVTVQQTLNGKCTYVDFTYTHGTYYPDSNFFSLWFGGSPNLLMNTVLEDFKCYDSNKNNLGVQSNMKGCIITHHGELEDYAGCEALYYCDEDASLYALYENKTLIFTESNVSKKGTYIIDQNVMKVSLDEQISSYDYLFQYFTGEDNRQYRRLHSYKVIFETGSESEIPTQVANADNGYMALRPEEPTKEGNTFEGWYTDNGEKYEFDRLVTESITLHAKWSDTEYTDGKVKGNLSPYVAVAGSVIILAAASTCGVAIIRRRGKHDNN